ncbi:peptidoglycan-binding protein [Lachnotalea glycerini]|uniref:Peptidoglycan-binding protein n=1 Tax=Lachnotalea glycerini TaxID=1763509 RepID=A0A371JFC5_9FIRM|nr:peptidoglycan-binding protein [Lachnotalea glycerini]RDY31431.1 peptidoglycan-binding protein [Lachnotalea glycerini]
MRNKSLRIAQDTATDKGTLKVIVTAQTGLRPIKDAVIKISYTGNPTGTIEQLNTNDSGQSDTVSLDAPPIDYSLEPSAMQPYSEYTLQVEAKGFESIVVSGTQILADTNAIQEIRLRPLEPKNMEDNIVIPAHTLYGEYPPKIAEAEIKPVNESGEIVLSKVVIPEYVIVHDGVPTDPTAANYYVKYKDYIKNVASSEIYATWPTSTIEANVLAIMSFTLNRVYTEWYRNKGFDFTITSSTAFDHKWMRGRNIFNEISMAVDSLFSNYLSRPNVKQPILTQYCDGNRVICPNWLSQWGSKDLGSQGYMPIDILRYYYGDNMYINSAEEISGVPSSWPGYNLQVGSSGDSVRQMQEFLNTIAGIYPSLPTIPVDGIFGPKTDDAVKAFQGVFGLPPNGIVDYPTWYKISEIYVGVSRIAELV